MELKMKYHYSYFVYPYVIKEKSYNKYIQRLLKSSKFKAKFFVREKSHSIYNFFLPTIRGYMFKSFDLAERYSKTSNSTYDKLKENIFKSNPCVVFEYNLGKDIQAKAGNDNRNIFQNRKNRSYLF